MTLVREFFHLFVYVFYSFFFGKVGARFVDLTSYILAQVIKTRSTSVSYKNICRLLRCGCSDSVVLGAHIFFMRANLAQICLRWNRSPQVKIRVEAKIAHCRSVILLVLRCLQLQALSVKWKKVRLWRSVYLFLYYNPNGCFEKKEKKRKEANKKSNSLSNICLYTDAISTSGDRKVTLVTYSTT